MTYFVPTPDSTQWFYWIRPGGQDPLISKWPKAGSTRTDCRFNLPVSKGKVWTAGRWWNEIDIRSGPSIELLRGWLDLQALGVNHLFGSAGVSASGIECTLDVVGYDAVPIFGWPGVVAITRWESGGGANFLQYELYFEDGASTEWDISMTLIPENAFFADITTGGAWNNIIIGGQQGALSDCYTFPLLAPPEAGFCACNGIDSYITFLPRFPLVATRFKMQFDIRPRGPDQQYVAQGLTTFSGNFYGLNNIQNFRWWTLGIPLSSPLAFDVWQTVRCEYDWSIPGGAYNVWVDDVLKGTLAAGFITWVWDEIGRRGPTISGDFDLRNVLMWNGTPAAPNLFVDVPLDIDACAVVPLGTKGSTINMVLPSCP